MTQNGKDLIGKRVEIPVHFDWWARGARYGTVKAFRYANHDKGVHSDCLLVRLDALPNGKCVRVYRLDWPYMLVVD